MMSICSEKFPTSLPQRIRRIKHKKRVEDIKKRFDSRNTSLTVALSTIGR